MNGSDLVDRYISQFPAGVQEKLVKLRRAIKKAAPGAEEVISYQMPAYKQNGIILWFAAHKEHIGLYPKAEALAVFKDELSGYKCTKGTIQFPLGQPVPYKLVEKIVRFRVKENLNKAKTKKK